MVPCLLRLATACLCALPLFPAGGGADSHWLKIKTANFEVFTPAGEKAGRELARHFEQVRSFFQDAMSLGLQSASPVRIIAFRSDRDYQPYAPNEIASAFYLGTDDRDSIVMKNASAQGFPVAVHEYMHLLLKHTGIDPPVWFNEGISELYSNLKPSGAKIEVGDLIMPHFILLRASKWIDLRTLLAAKHDSPLYNEKTHAGLFYAESWALVHMLYLDEEYRPKWPVLVDRIKTGAGMDATFRRAYNKPVEQVQHDLESYMHRTRFNASFFPVTLPKAIDAPEVTASSGLETGLVLAEILANIGNRTAEAREAYTRLARDNPKSWQVEEARARLEWQEEKIAEALAHFRRATELGSNNPKMYLLYGRLLRVEDQGPQAIPVLRRATELDPEDQDAHLELGFAYVVAGRFDDALSQFQAVKRVTPAQAFGYLHAMAYAYYRLGRKDSARATVANCRKYARTPEQTAQLDQLIETLNFEPTLAAEPTTGDEGDAADKPLPFVEGTLEHIDCPASGIRMRIVVGGKVQWFAIPSDQAKELTCGPQNSRRIRIEYEPKPDVLPGTIGVVRSIEFLQ